MEIELSTRAFLEEQTCAIVDHANFELDIQKGKAESTVHNLTQQLRQQYMELCSRSQDFEKS